MINYSDEAIITGLKEKRGVSIDYLYSEYFPMVKSIVVKNFGTYEDAEDVFHDGLMILYEKIQKGTLVLTCSLKTFFFAICRHIWLQRLERKTRLIYCADVVNESAEDYYSLPFEIDEANLEKVRICQFHFLFLPEDCQKILRMFFSKVKMSEIAICMGFKDPYYAKVRKYLCKNMLRKKILNDPRYKTYFDNE
jgi:RNA polymerase sigma factor (sigma-70 family)